MPRSKHLVGEAQRAQDIASSLANDLDVKPPRLGLGTQPPPAMAPLATPLQWNWSAEEWSAPQMAYFLDVSPAFIRKKIRQGVIRAARGGPLAWGSQEGDGDEWEHYRISRHEVKRLVNELVLPTTGETLAQRLERGLRRAQHDLPVLKIPVESFLNLEFPEGDLRDLVLGFAASRPRRRRGNEAIYPSTVQD